jgi:hypothetical protein
VASDDQGLALAQTATVRMVKDDSGEDASNVHGPADE